MLYASCVLNIWSNVSLFDMQRGVDSDPLVGSRKRPGGDVSRGKTPVALGIYPMWALLA